MKEAREALAMAAKLGFHFAGYTGSGHIRLRHLTGAIYIVSRTPSDGRARRNMLADLERISGRKLPGKHRG